MLNLPVRVMFQDEARFGRLSDPRRCWAPAPLRPTVGLALIREYTYAYAAVSPQDGALDWMLAPKMDTLNMSAFLDHLSQRHPEDFILMVGHRTFVWVPPICCGHGLTTCKAPSFLLG
jgi:hypothetical protein